jgi:hypothetical protein
VLQTFGISPIWTVWGGQFSCWYKYSGGAVKGLHIKTRFGIIVRFFMFEFTCKFTKDHYSLTSFWHIHQTRHWHVDHDNNLRKLKTDMTLALTSLMFESLCVWSAKKLGIGLDTLFLYPVWFINWSCPVVLSCSVLYYSV